MRLRLVPLIALPTLAIVAGCTGTGSVTPVPDSAAHPQATATPCNAVPAQFAVGQSATASLVEQARQKAGAQEARVLRPGQMVTKEYNLQRLNLNVDAQGKVLSVTCG